MNVKSIYVCDDGDTFSEITWDNYRTYKRAIPAISLQEVGCISPQDESDLLNMCHEAFKVFQYFCGDTSIPTHNLAYRDTDYPEDKVASKQVNGKLINASRAQSKIENKCIDAIEIFLDWYYTLFCKWIQF